LNNIGTGIRVGNVENGSIFNNTITNTGAKSRERWGILAGGGVSGANKNIFANNTIVNTQYPFEVGENDNLIVYNNLFDQGNGIWVTGNNNVVANNSVQDAGGSGGIWIRNSVNTTISKNFLYKNWEGITLENSNDSTISSNNIIENGYGVHLDPYSAHNLVSLNIFRMNIAEGIPQAVDYGINNIFTQNYWHEWTSPDVNEDGFVDNSYSLDGLANNVDSLPLVSTDQISILHLLSIPLIFYPEEGATLNRTVVIQWGASFDSEEHSVSYSISYSLNNGNSWTLIASDLTSTSYSWDTSALPLGSKVLIQIVATCSEGSSVTYISARPYNIPHSIGPFLFYLFPSLL
jgi:parallel beta-helix repeat protein